MAEFPVAGVQYRCGKLDARKQFHVARRLAVILDKLAPHFANGAGIGEGGADLIGPLAEAVAGMKDEDVDYILDACLAVVERKDGQSWIHVFNASSKRLQYQDIDMVGMLTMAANVIQENLGGFTDGLQRLSPGGRGTTSKP